MCFLETFLNKDLSVGTDRVILPTPCYHFRMLPKHYEQWATEKTYRIHKQQKTRMALNAGVSTSNTTVARQTVQTADRPDLREQGVGEYFVSFQGHKHLDLLSLWKYF